MAEADYCDDYYEYWNDDCYEDCDHCSNEDCDEHPRKKQRLRK